MPKFGELSLAISARDKSTPEVGLSFWNFDNDRGVDISIGMNLVPMQYAKRKGNLMGTTRRDELYENKPVAE